MMKYADNLIATAASENFNMMLCDLSAFMFLR